MLDEVYEEYALHMSAASKVYFFVVIEVSLVFRNWWKTKLSLNGWLGRCIGERKHKDHQVHLFSVSRR